MLTIAAVCDMPVFSSSSARETTNRVANRAQLPAHLFQLKIPFHLAIIPPINYSKQTRKKKNVADHQMKSILTKARPSERSPFTLLTLTSHTCSRRSSRSSDRRITRLTWFSRSSTQIPSPKKSFKKRFSSKNDSITLSPQLPGEKSRGKEIGLGSQASSQLPPRSCSPGRQGQCETSLPRHYRSRVFPNLLATSLSPPKNPLSPRTRGGHAEARTQSSLRREPRTSPLVSPLLRSLLLLLLLLVLLLLFLPLEKRSRKIVQKKGQAIEEQSRHDPIARNEGATKREREGEK